ncbi:hypothetical protein BD413DRAFT_219587 [Trametes elegans]|nr:hypothetical protein BD413DRAFT_219587 [Trametes elegans]
MGLGPHLEHVRLLPLDLSSEPFQVMLDQIAALYNFGKFQYSYGNYSATTSAASPPTPISPSPPTGVSSHATSSPASGTSRSRSSTLSGRPLTPALPPCPSLPSPHHLLPTRLLHWSLFVYFSHPQGRTPLLETFLSPTYLNTIQTSCPWILRYLATAAVLSRKSSSGSLSLRYQDPITPFLKSLYVEFDFEAAQKELGKAETIVANDFFLGELFTVYVSGLFLQVFAYILGCGLEIILPGPQNSRLRTKDTPFWRFINPGKFSACSPSPPLSSVH